MRNLIIILLIIASSILYFSCSNADNKPVSAINQDSTIIVTIAPIPSDSIHESEESIMPKPSVTNSQTPLEISPIETSAIVNTVVVSEIQASSTDLSLSQEIISLSELLKHYENLEFRDCGSFETAINEFTTKFFSIIERIELSDEQNISKLKELEGFSEVFEPEFERVEKECPDLYNDYMEYLDEYTDEYYSKLEIMFAEDKNQ
jgi:hypothetical protein